MARWTRRLALLFLPLLLMGQDYGSGSPRVANRAPEVTPIYANSFELSAGCAADVGDPPAAVSGDGNCDCTDVGACSAFAPFPDGAQVWYGDGFQSDVLTYVLDRPDLEEGWVRFRFLMDAVGTGSIALHFSGMYPSMYLDGSEKVWLRCPNATFGDVDDYVMQTDTWYIVQLHWWNFDGVTEFPEAEAEVYLQSDLSKVVDSITCTGDQDWADIGLGNIQAGGGKPMAYDCIEWYDNDPGVPRKTCNLR